MNLTFYENLKEVNKTNIKFPSIFSKFETERKNYMDSLCPKSYKNQIFLPDYKNIGEEIAKLKKQFRNLFEIKNTIFKKMITKENSTIYKNFIKGFGKYFFGPFGIVTQNNKFLRDYYFKISALNKKIFAGRLDYYDHMNKFNRYKQRKNIAHKRILSNSKNFIVITDKDNVYSAKAKIPKRLTNNKDFVSLNRLKYRESITEIKENSPDNKKINEVMNQTFNIKNNSKDHKNKSMNKIKNKTSLNLITYNNFYNGKNRNLFGNYIKAVSYNKNIVKKNIFKGFNTENSRNNSHIHVKFRRAKINDGNNSNFFLTQENINNNERINTNLFPKGKISFNRLINLKRNNNVLNKHNKSRNMKNLSFRT